MDVSPRFKESAHRCTETDILKTEKAKTLNLAHFRHREEAFRHPEGAFRHPEEAFRHPEEAFRRRRSAFHCKYYGSRFQQKAFILVKKASLQVWK
jgi:hypothetical protein